jgi:glycosyltransferase involved in cell wall biosynthesis
MGAHMPKVSFIVPCYRLGHLLAECVNSILAQTYGDFEVLIMDDCSPDTTPEIACSFPDSRIRYVRNESNLGHLRNYNKGIELSRGEYVWLISADDRLRKPYMLERYVDVMDGNPRVGYVCCPGIKLENGLETNIEGSVASRDKIFPGKEFLAKLLEGNFVLAASGMVRRLCYEMHGKFPLDLPYTGDWFLWCHFALYWDVAYFAEPMVNYRSHELSMTNYLMSQRLALSLREGFLVLRRIRDEAAKMGNTRVAKECDLRLASLYGIHLAGCTHENLTYVMTEKEFEAELSQEHTTGTDMNQMRAMSWEAAGDWCVRTKKVADADTFYMRALEHNRLMIKVRVKRALLNAGGVGAGIRGLLQLRRDLLR